MESARLSLRMDCELNKSRNSSYLDCAQDIQATASTSTPSRHYQEDTTGDFYSRGATGSGRGRFNGYRTLFNHFSASQGHVNYDNSSAGPSGMDPSSKPKDFNSKYSSTRSGGACAAEDDYTPDMYSVSSNDYFSIHQQRAQQFYPSMNINLSMNMNLGLAATAAIACKPAERSPTAAQRSPYAGWSSYEPYYSSSRAPDNHSVYSSNFCTGTAPESANFDPFTNFSDYPHNHHASSMDFVNYTSSSPYTSHQTRSLMEWPLMRNSCRDAGLEKPNVCHVCGKAYARSSTLKTHMRTHSGERPFRCEICKKTFSQAANLTAHQRTHSGEKPFKCLVCDRRFSQSSSVTTHMRTHSGERPYACPLCQKAFSDSSTLTKHLRVHTGQKPYQCPHCLLRFSQSGNLNRHMKVHQPSPPPQEDQENSHTE